MPGVLDSIHHGTTLLRHMVMPSSSVEREAKRIRISTIAEMNAALERGIYGDAVMWEAYMQHRPIWNLAVTTLAVPIARDARCEAKAQFAQRGVTYKSKGRSLNHKPHIRKYLDDLVNTLDTVLPTTFHNPQVRETLHDLTGQNEHCSLKRFQTNLQLELELNRRPPPVDIARIPVGTPFSKLRDQAQPQIQSAIDASLVVALGYVIRFHAAFDWIYYKHGDQMARMQIAPTINMVRDAAEENPSQPRHIPNSAVIQKISSAILYCDQAVRSNNIKVEDGLELFLTYYHRGVGEARKVQGDLARKKNNETFGGFHLSEPSNSTETPPALKDSDVLTSREAVPGDIEVLKKRMRRKLGLNATAEAAPALPTSEQHVSAPASINAKNFLQDLRAQEFITRDDINTLRQAVRSGQFEAESKEIREALRHLVLGLFARESSKWKIHRNNLVPLIAGRLKCPQYQRDLNHTIDSMISEGTLVNRDNRQHGVTGNAIVIVPPDQLRRYRGGQRS